MTKICSRERSDGYALLLAFQVSHGMYIEYEKWFHTREPSMYLRPTKHTL